MRIVLVSPEFYPVFFGGISKVAYDIAVGLANRNHEVTVLSTDAHQARGLSVNKPIQIAQNLQVLYLATIFRFLHQKKIYIPSLRAPRLVEDAIRRADLIHIHSYRNPINILVSSRARALGTPYLIQTHGTLPRVMNMRRLKFLYDQLFGQSMLAHATKVLALNRFEASQFTSAGIPQDKTAIVPNAIDAHGLERLAPGLEHFRQRHHIRKNQRIVLFLGRLHASKGVDLLIKAFWLLSRESVYDNVVLVIAGPDDGFLSTVVRLTTALGLNSRVFLTGFLNGDEKLEALAEAEVVVFPSRYEIFPMSLLEAYACKKPVVAFDVGGLGELILNRSTGILVNPENIESFASAISEILRDDERRREMGRQAFALLEATYSLEKNLDKLERLYLSILRNKP